jgi:hypothetical protein
MDKEQTLSSKFVGSYHINVVITKIKPDICKECGRELWVPKKQQDY